MNHNDFIKIKSDNILYLPSFHPKLKSILSNTKSPLVVIADYDNTLTKAFANSKPSRSAFGVIEESALNSPQYISDAKALDDKCREYENDISIHFNKRKEIMENWYNAGLELMVNEKISKDLLHKMVCESVNEKHVMFREGIEDFFTLLIAHNIPLILISGGIKQVIEGEFKLFTKHYDTLIKKGLLKIIANEFIFKDDIVVDYVKPTILTFNKNQFLNDEIVLLQNETKKNANSNANAHNEKNIIFLGDHLNDIDAIIDLKYNTCLSFAFYNVLQGDVPQSYCDNYDVVIRNDGDFLIVNEVISKIFQ